MKKINFNSKAPPLFRLTLTPEAFALVAERIKGPISPKLAIRRGDGKWDVGISMSMADQLMTAAFKGENLSDTVLRVMSVQKGLN